MIKEEMETVLKMTNKRSPSQFQMTRTVYLKENLLICVSFDLCKTYYWRHSMDGLIAIVCPVYRRT